VSEEPGPRRRDYARWIAVQNAFGWLVALAVLAYIYIIQRGEPISPPVLIIALAGLFIFTPMLYLLVRRYTPED
jgi:uncharacterized membrane protein YhaH (DUF805 family)